MWANLIVVFNFRPSANIPTLPFPMKHPSHLPSLLPATLASLLLPLSALADVSVDNVTAKQRYPWNGLVDITCVVSGIDGMTNGLKFAVAAVVPDSGDFHSVSHFWVVRGETNSTDRLCSTNGAYKLLWDAHADLGEAVYSNMIVRVTAIDRHGEVQLWAGGPYWAEMNVGAEEPWEYGYYFWWGDTVGYKRVGSAWVASDGSSSNFSFGSSNTPTFAKSDSTLQSEGWITAAGVLASAHDAAHVHWGGNWRMPTDQELRDLCYNKCDWTWTTTNGVSGYVVRGRGDYASASIFLPAAGIGYGTSLYIAGSDGHYWSSVPLSDYGSSWSLYFYSGYHDVNDNYRYYGRSVRPVQGFTD